MTAVIPLIAARVVEAVRARAHRSPVWSGDDKTLYFVSMPTPGRDDRPRVDVDAVRFDGCPLRALTGPLGAGRVRTVVPDADAATAMCADAAGNLLICEAGGPRSPARISRLDRRTGSRETVVADFTGQPMNRPTGVTLHPDGSIWFTDSHHGGYRGSRSRAGEADPVYRYDPASGEQTLVRTVVDHPNGLAFAPDGRTLYVADCGADHASGGIDPERPHTVSALQVRAGHIVDHLWTHTVRFGSPAGLKTDPAGRVWFTVGDGLRVLSPEGEQLGDLPLAGAVDFTFAGADDVLLVTTNTAVLAVVLDPSF